MMSLVTHKGGHLAKSVSKFLGLPEFIHGMCKRGRIPIGLRERADLFTVSTDIFYSVA